MNLTKDKVYVHDGWIHVEGVGRIGLYSSYDKAILLDYSMKFIVGTNERILCDRLEVVDKIVELFNKKEKVDQPN